ncbi:dienelactone hydrolase family protein [Actinoplanes sp. N902-109]|uniref:dienelactone hydrolase family protein n=1 Tax=Actinoplanes sp. (strain N902-109) TaxID=649831 RepID=UPI0003296729|nr:dienelactone hydrolase family protein [Actinoplanes sp. N902-109]AGL18344.1 putative hydrolase [Actinoplanes sp. N902-109]
MTFSAAHQTLLESVPAGAGARIEGETVEYKHEDTTLEGYLAHDAAITERRPAVLVVHDWTGLREYPKVRAQMLARLGYVAFAVDVYGAGVRPEGQEEAAAEANKYYGNVPLFRARVQAGYERLLADPRIDPERVAVIGYCFGGSAALEFARTGAPLRGAVSFHGALNTHEPSDAGQITAPLLIMTGAADPVVPDEAVVAYQDELRAADVDFEIISYSGAPHAFTLPEIPQVYRPKADARSWQRLTGFLDEIFG